MDHQLAKKCSMDEIPGRGSQSKHVFRNEAARDRKRGRYVPGRVTPSDHEDSRATTTLVPVRARAATKSLPAGRLARRAKRPKPNRCAQAMTFLTGWLISISSVPTAVVLDWLLQPTRGHCRSNVRRWMLSPRKSRALVSQWLKGTSIQTLFFSLASRAWRYTY